MLCVYWKKINDDDDGWMDGWMDGWWITKNNIITFVDKIKYKDFSQKDLTKGFKKYFENHSKIMYNINNVKGIN